MWLFLLVSNVKKRRLGTIFLCVKEKKLKEVIAIIFLRKAGGWALNSTQQTFPPLHREAWDLQGLWPGISAVWEQVRKS